MRTELPDRPNLCADEAARLQRDFETFATTPMPRMLEEYVLEQYGIDLNSSYGGKRIRNPFGKASGQLSNTIRQVQLDAEACLGFCVLKTVIAVDASGQQSMKEWATHVTRMQVEPITGKSGLTGWTVSWIGRGWHDTFEKYLEFFDEALAIGDAAEMLIVPSVKYHLPGPDEDEWHLDEYRFTTTELLKVWRSHHPDEAMPIEKDFSPTLAGDQRSRYKQQIVNWVRIVPKLINEAARMRTGREGEVFDPEAQTRRAPAEPVTIGLKLFNAMFEDEFQLDLLRAAIDEGRDGVRADYLVYGNRLFDPDREFDGKRGIAYGGPDLSERNLRALRALRQEEQAGRFAREVQPISATGDIDCGRKAIEYELLGCENFQMHTLFQLPDSCYSRKVGSRSEKALHHLLFHPDTGYLAWKLHLQKRAGYS